MFIVFSFFFSSRRRHTRFDCDWSSDVCSSDLTLTLPELRSRDQNLVRLTFTDPLFLLSLRQTDGRTNLLANPRIRVKNKEKAKIHIGDRVPVITTTAAVAGGFVSQSVSYLDVGLQLEVEPLIYLEDDVGIKVGLEVSNITKDRKSVV